MFPTINPNGTNPDELITAIEDASYAISLACEALEKTAPHERDYPDKNPRRAYYVDGTGKRTGKSRIFIEPKLVEARHAIQADLTHLRNILLRLQTVWISIDDQMVLRDRDGQEL